MRSDWMKDNVFIVGLTDRSQDDVTKTLLYFYPGIEIQIWNDGREAIGQLEEFMKGAKKYEQIHIRGMGRHIYLVEV